MWTRRDVGEDWRFHEALSAACVPMSNMSGAGSAEYVWCFVPDFTLSSSMGNVSD